MKYRIEICGFDYHPAVIINGRYASFGYTRRSFNQAWEECWILATNTDSTWQNWIRPDGLERLEALGFVGDLSPSDNACPNWSHELYPVRVWVDLPLGSSEITNDPADWSQYALTDDDTQEDLYQTDDITDVISYINAMIANVGRYGATARQLRDKGAK